MSIIISPLSEACGAEITGVDMKKTLSREDAATIYQAWLDHLVIVIRAQDHLTPTEQKEFCKNFGKIGEYNRPKSRQHPKYANDEIMLVSNVREEGRVIGAHPDGEMMWHTDTPYVRNPHKATTLYAVEIPTIGGNTRFSNQYKVFEELSTAVRKALTGKKAMNCYEFGTTVKNFDKYERDKVPHYPHPVFRKHPETGRIAVYVCPLMTEEIIDMDETEGDELLRDIYSLQRQTKFIYSHEWRVGDFIMWDNRCLLHARTDFPREQRRLLRRVTIADEARVLEA